MALISKLGPPFAMRLETKSDCGIQVGILASPTCLVGGWKFGFEMALGDNI